MFYVIGGSGIPNYGDELIASHWLGFFRRNFPDKRVLLECSNPSISSLFLADVNPRCSHLSIVKTIAKRNPKETFWENVERGLTFLDRDGFREFPIYTGIERILEQVEIVHLMGGGYMNQNWPHTGFLPGFAAAMKRRYGTRVVATGVGVMPLGAPPPELAETARRMLDAFDLLECRDDEGGSFLAGLSPRDNVISGLDDTFLQAIEPADGPGGRTLHISLFLQEQKLDDALKRILLSKDAIARDFDRILFWNCAPDRDRQAWDKVRAAFPSAVEVGTWDLVASLPVRPGDRMITTRFHPHLLAARAGARGFYISSGDYYATKHGSVTALGSPFRSFDEFTRFGLSDPNPGTIVAQDAGRVSAKRALVERIYGRI